MRRILAVAVLGAALLSGAACSDNGASSGGTPTPTITGGITATPTGTASDKQVCADVQTLVANSTQKFTQEMLKVAQAGGSKDAETAAVTAVKTLLSDWATGLRTQSSRAANPELKTSLSQWADGLEKAGRDINTAADLEKLGELNTPELTTSADKAEEICSRNR